jgi:FkbM family methyltransferase
MRAILPPERESELKEEFFGHATQGFFVEVGAYDPEILSQTFHLEQRGWTGVLVEPQPDCAARLKAQRKAQVFAVACSSPANAGTTMTLHVADIFSSFAPELTTATTRAEGAIDVPVTTLDAILTEAGAPAPIDFLSIDIEGHEIPALDGFDLARWRPRLLLIEDLAMDTVLHRYLTRRGYRWVRRTGINSWYVPADSAMHVDLEGRLQFFRKYYLGRPFRHLREASRRIRQRLREGRDR